jgi:MHS family proline/betaine transporter-like MFS transporter
VTDITPARPAAHRVAVAAAVGNLLEWFDFALYGFFAVTIGKVFFPSGNPTASLLAALAVFGVAFLVRPLGGIVLGAFGDGAGRRASLSACVLLMGVSTMLIAVLPTYAGVGVLAPVLLVALRCLQGFSAGGEYAGAAAFLLEYAPDGRRGLWSSIVSATAAIGVMCGGLVTLGLTAVLTDAQLESWGWRLPFLLAAPLSIVGLYLRLRLEDTPVYRDLQRSKQVATAPLRRAGRQNRSAIALVFACTAVAGLGFYYLATYTVTFLTVTVGLKRPEAVLLAVGGLAVYSLLCPLAGMVGDRIGRRPTFLTGAAGLTVVAIPCFALISTGHPALVLLGLVVFATFESLANVMLGVLLVELFPAQTRVSGSAVGFNLAQAVIGGPGPLVAAALAAGLAFSVAPALYIVLIAGLATLLLARALPETRGVTVGAVADPHRFDREPVEAPVAQAAAI